MYSILCLRLNIIGLLGQFLSHKVSYPSHVPSFHITECDIMDRFENFRGQDLGTPALFVVIFIFEQVKFSHALLY